MPTHPDATQLQQLMYMYRAVLCVTERRALCHPPPRAAGMTGSAMYMCPEVWSRQPYNDKADVFSFGVLLYELMGRTMLEITHLATRLPRGVRAGLGHAHPSAQRQSCRELCVSSMLHA